MNKFKILLQPVKYLVRLNRKIIFIYYTQVFLLKLKYKCNNLTLGKGVKAYGKVVFNVSRNSKITIGNNVILRSKTKYNYIGINKPIIMSCLDNATLTIGDNSGFSGTSIYVSNKIIIGKNCLFGANTNIWDTDFHPIEYLDRRNPNLKGKSRAIIINDDVFIGANATILKGSEIGSRTVIGASSVVAGKLEQDSIYIGNPIRRIK